MSAYSKNELIEMGCICAICNVSLLEEYGRPLTCEECGGDAVADPESTIVDELEEASSQFGVGA